MGQHLPASTRAARLPIAGRPGFTLVEILVVVAIIGVLSALVAAAVSKVIPAQQQKNTEMTIRKTSAALMSHWRAVVDTAQNESRNLYNNGSTLPTIGVAGGDAERAKILWTKLRLVQQFPMTYQEALYPAPGLIGPNPTYQKNLTNAGITAAPPSPSGPIPPPTPETEQDAACLLMALTLKAHASVKTELDSFNANERSTNSAGLPMLVDNWGYPIVFYRWPTENPDVQAQMPTTAKTPDPIDTTGRLLDPNWNNQANAATILAVERAIKHPIHVMIGNTWTPRLFYTVPVVASMGPDKSLGLNYNMGLLGSDANDNIFSNLLK